MAKVELNGSFNEMAGKIGGIVYAEGREGTVSRQLVTPKNPRTPAQSGSRTALGKAAAAYKNLTTAQVALWNVYASNITKRGRNGKTFHPTAIDAFTALASKYLQITPAGTLPLTPPTAAFTGDNLTVTAVGATGKVTFTASNASAPPILVELLLQPLKSHNRVPSEGAYRSKGFVVFVAGTLSKDVTVPAGTYAAAYHFVSPMTGQMTPTVMLPNVTVV